MLKLMGSQIRKVEKLPCMELYLKYFSITNFRNRLLYLSGGMNFDDDRNEVYVYDFQSREWADAPSMNKKRFRHSSCSLGEHVYAFFGHN